MVYRPAFGSHGATILVKYVLQAADTLRLLRRETPDVVFVMSPPPIAVLPVLAYCRSRRIPFVIDAHSAAFLHRRWRGLQWLQDALSRRAATTIVTNEHLAMRVRGAGAHATIIRDVPVVFQETAHFVRDDRFTVAFVCSFSPDEPVGDVLEAARALPQIRFLITGDGKGISKTCPGSLPGNVELTGFLPEPAYGGLLCSVDAVIALTTRDHTMQRAAYEAIYQGTPVVVSNWPLLRRVFDEGAVHVGPGAAALVDGLKALRSQHEAYREGAARLRERRLVEWAKAKEGLLARVEECRLGGRARQRHPDDAQSGSPPDAR
jgi:glycosyltransferase involved in cell wall biosynthesis